MACPGSLGDLPQTKTPRFDGRFQVPALPALQRGTSTCFQRTHVVVRNPCDETGLTAPKVSPAMPETAREDTRRPAHIRSSRVSPPPQPGQMEGDMGGQWLGAVSSAARVAKP